MVDLQAKWDEPWRSLREDQVRHLALIVDENNRSGEQVQESLSLGITVSFWTAGYSIVNAAEVDISGASLDAIPYDIRDGSTSFFMQVPTGRQTLVILTVLMRKTPGLSVGRENIGFVKVGTSEIPLGIDIGFSRSGSIEYSVL